MRFTALAVLVFATLPLLRAAELKSLDVSVEAGKFDRVNVPVRVAIDVPAGAKSATLKDASGKTIPGQITAPSLLSTAAPDSRELVFILPSLKAGESATFKVSVSDATPEGTVFKWHDTPGDFTELKLSDRPILRYMYKAIDTSTPAARDLTYKVFHHLYDPAGTRLVTKGPGGKFPHHRGIYYGFKCTHNGKVSDTWHCTKETHLAHDKFLQSEEGPVLGRHRVIVKWVGIGNEHFANEERELTVYNVPGGQMVEFASRLKGTTGTVKVGGDPQHAGFHFRADNEVSEKTAKQTYYIRPDGIGKPGETRNHPGNKDHVNLAFNAMSFVLGEKRYTCCYLDRAENPKEARFSERDYGRFGSYFETEFDDKKTLDVNYRLWFVEGELKQEEVAAKDNDFDAPVKATVK